MTDTEPRAEVDPRYSDPNASATPWNDVRELLERAELFWIATVRADGRPHVTPVPTVWRDDALHFCTGAEEQKAVNLARNASCTLTTGNNEWKQGLDVVVEGRAERVVDDKELQHLADLWSSKYHGDWQFEVRDGAFQQDAGEAIVFRVAPTKILAFAKGDFAQSRYRF
jgi:PPOX class probable F420-dependent enzyme